MRLLWIATKPPVPPIDGGRLVAWLALDYGCGAGEVVEAGRSAGLDVSGVEVFYEGGSYRDAAEKKGLLGGAIRELRKTGASTSMMERSMSEVDAPERRASQGPTTGPPEPGEAV